MSFGRVFFCSDFAPLTGNLQKKPKDGLGGGMFTIFLNHDLHPKDGQDVSGGFFVSEMDFDHGDQKMR